MTNIIFDNITFNMFVYKKGDCVSGSIMKHKSWEIPHTKELLSALEYYSKKQNIPNHDIFVLDIGANIGWYSLILGYNGYNILSFEPSKVNYYILLKNYCMNKNIKMTIINKGLDIYEKNYSLYHPMNNIGNAFIFGNLSIINIQNYVKEEIILTTLNNYITFLNKNNLALIKLDIEGSEEKAIESGKNLIVKYHIPFIFMEWTPNLIIERGTDQKSFLEFFEKNGYKMSTKGFFSREYCPIKDLIDINAINIYIVYIKFLE